VLRVFVWDIHNKKSLITIKSANDRHQRSPPLIKPFLIIGDPRFTDTNKTLNNYWKTLSKRGDIALKAHKQALTKGVCLKSCLKKESRLSLTCSILENCNKPPGSSSVLSSVKEVEKMSIP